MLRLFRLVVPALVLLSPSLAVARPLDPEACGKLKGEIAALETGGVQALLDKGPAAAKETASREQLRELRKYFDLLGTFRFQCPQEAPLVVLRPEPPSEPGEAAAAYAPIEAGAPGITLPAGVSSATVGPVAPSPPRKPAVAKKAPVKAATAPAAAPATPPATGTAAPAAKKPAQPKATKTASPAAGDGKAETSPAAKPKPKPKADDAYRPPAPAAPPAASAPAAPPAAFAPKSP